MNPLIKTLVDGTIKSIGTIVDKTTTSSGEKSQMKNELAEIVMNGVSSVATAQKEVLTTELKGNFLQRSWRPLLMLTFGFILICKWFGWTDANIEVELETELLSIVKLGIGGYVIGRSVEKTAGVLTKNVDMPFMRRRDRKKIFE